MVDQSPNLTLSTLHSPQRSRTMALERCRVREQPENAKRLWIRDEGAERSHYFLKLASETQYLLEERVEEQLCQI